MRRYDVAAAALAIGADRRWIDNAITHFTVHGVQRSARGRTRRLLPDSVLQLALAHQLWIALQLPVGRALELAHLMSTDGTVERDGFRLSIDIAGLRRELEHRLAAAVESAIAPRRGRPPLRR